MQKSNEHTASIIAILQLARDINENIGGYAEHYLDESFNYRVRLSNGGIRVPRTMAHDFEVMPESVTEEQVKIVASSFVSS